MNKLGNPYKEMATTCMTRPMAEKKVVWKRFESEPFEEGRFQAKVLSRRCINSAARVFRKAYPEVYGSPHEEWSLAPEFRELWEVLERINKQIGQKGDVPPWLKEFDPWFLKDF